MAPTPHRPAEDELLAIRCQLGEPAAFDELIARWHMPLWSFVRRLVGEDDAAREIDDLRRVTASELSLTARTGYVGLLLAAGTMTVVVTALLVTEPALPLRASTRSAFWPPSA